jgi:beta-lactam-binding protein with PASTA domain
MPTDDGDERKAVRDKIKDAGLEGDGQVKDTGDKKVQSQNPSAGTSVECGTTVNYTYKK